MSLSKIGRIQLPALYEDTEKFTVPEEEEERDYLFEEELTEEEEPEDPLEPWQKVRSLPTQDGLRRDWSRYNRKLSYMYPNIVLPGWRREADHKR